MNGASRERIRVEQVQALAWYEQGLNYSQIGGLLRLSTGSVGRRLRQARINREAALEWVEAVDEPAH